MPFPKFLFKMLFRLVYFNSLLVRSVTFPCGVGIFTFFTILEMEVLNAPLLLIAAAPIVPGIPMKPSYPVMPSDDNSHAILVRL